MRQFDPCEIVVDLNPKILKGTRGTVLEVYDGGKAFEVEFMDEEGENIAYKGQLTFLVSKEQIKPIS